MNKIILSVIASSLLWVSGQAQYYKISSLLEEKKYDEAYLKYQEIKTKDIKNKMATDPNAYYWLGMIYQKLSDSPVLAKKIQNLADSNLSIAALKQFRECLTLKPDYSELRSTGGQILYMIYSKNFQHGIDLYNEKKYDDATENLIVADSASKLIYNNKFGLSALDTQLYYYTGLAFVNAIVVHQKDSMKQVLYKAQAQKYFDALVNANYTSGMKDVTKWVLSLALSAKDETDFNKYLDFAKSHYPEDNNLWRDFESEFMLKAAGNDKQKVIEIYKQLQAKNPNNYTFFYNESIEVFDYLTQNLDHFDELLPELERTAQESFKLNSEAYQPLYLIQKAYIAKFDSYGDSIRNIQKNQRAIAAQFQIPPKANKAQVDKINKAKAEKLALGKAQIDQYTKMQEKYSHAALPISLQLCDYFEAKVVALDAKDKAVYKEVLDNTSTFYDSLKDIDKSDFYNNKSNALK